MAVHHHANVPLRVPTSPVPDSSLARLSLDTKRCIHDWPSPSSEPSKCERKLCQLTDGSSGGLSLLVESLPLPPAVRQGWIWCFADPGVQALFQHHQIYALIFQMAFSVNFFSVVLQASGAHLRRDQACIPRDLKEALIATPPRNTRVNVVLRRVSSPLPARTTSERPSSSRSTGPPYYARPTGGSGNWGAPRPPTRLPEAQVASLLPTGYLPDNPGVISPERETK